MTSANWNDFLQENLLHTNLFCGACLISKFGEVVYTYKLLETLTEKDSEQFLRAFKTTSPTAQNEVVQNGFNVSLGTGQKSTRFKIYSKTNCSFYCTSDSNEMGLIVSRFSYGILLCLYIYPVTAAKAVNAAEVFCDMLRS